MKEVLYKKGFTLLDILLVSAIVSLLSSLFLFNLSEAKLKAQDAKMQTETQQISTAIALYKEDHGGSPPLKSSGGALGVQGVMHSESDTESNYLPTMEVLVNEGYLPKIPKSPSGKSYSYGVSSDGKDATFGAKLNKRVSNNSKKSCPNAPIVESLSEEPLFENCSFDTFCPVSEEEGICLLSSLVKLYCHCVYEEGVAPRPVSSDESIVPNEICAINHCIPEEPIEPEGPPPELLFSPLIKKAFAQQPIYYYFCSYNDAFTESTVPSCNGASNADYCQCI